MLWFRTFRRRSAREEATARRLRRCGSQVQHHAYPSFPSDSFLSRSPAVSGPSLHFVFLHALAHVVAAIDLGNQLCHADDDACTEAQNVSADDVQIDPLQDPHSRCAKHHHSHDSTRTYADNDKPVDVGAEPCYGNLLCATDPCTKQFQDLSHETLPHSLCWQQRGRRAKRVSFPDLQLLCEDGQLDKALVALFCMGFPPPTRTYICLLRACIESRSLFLAKQVHAHLVEHQVELSGILGDYLVVTLAKCGNVDIARQVSSKLPCLTVFSWTAMISAYVQLGHMEEAFRLYQKMQQDKVEPNTFTYVSLIKACSSMQDLELGKRLHADVRVNGCVLDAYVSSTIISMYGKCGAVGDAEELFAKLSDCSIVSWNAMLSTYVTCKQGQKALQLYRQMQHDGVVPDPHTLVYAFQACGVLLEEDSVFPLDEPSRRKVSLEIGEALHRDSRRKGFASDIFVATALLSAYAKCGAFAKAADVFESLPHHDIISWNAMISASIHGRKAEKALQMYKQMQLEGMSPDQLTCMLSLQACGAFAEMEEADGHSIKVIPLEIGQALHTDTSKKGFFLDLVVCNTLVNMYGKCGAVIEAEHVFNGMPYHDVVSWTAMLSAYLEHDQSEKAIWLYKEMQKASLVLDDIILVCMLQVCSETGNFEMCNRLHCDITSVGYNNISFLANTLIYTYGSCASMVDAHSVFEEFLKIDVVPWNTCIAGYAAEGDFVSSLYLFENMCLEGVQPDDLTFSSVLASCRHTGLVGIGVGYFEMLSKDYGMIPNLKHFASLFDLLSRAGDLRRVQSVLRRMPMQADLTIWLCVLGACCAHGNLDLASQAFTQAVSLQPTLAIPYILMGNTYANAGLRECAEEVERIRQEQGAWSVWMENEEDPSLLNLWE